jgi:hypothetical protein
VEEPDVAQAQEDETSEPSLPPSGTQEQLVQFIRFSLDELRSTNGHHRFEDLCRGFARAAIAPNILPATGPVGAGGDRGRDFETFRTFLRETLGPNGGFAGATPTGGRLAFICTLQQDDIPGKIRNDVDKIVSSGPPVHMIYAFLGAPLAKGSRDKLQDQVREAHGVEVEVVDGRALAEALATHEHFWIAEEFLSIPANLRPAAPDPGGGLPAWYQADRARWRARKEINPRMGELLDAIDGLRHATFNADARADLPFWLDLVGALDRDEVPAAVRQRARYEFAASSLRGLGDMRPADHAALSYLGVAATEEDDPARLEDAANLLSYAGTAVSFGHSDLDANELAELHDRLRGRVRAMLDEDPPRTRRARLLEVLGRLAVMPAATALRPVGGADGGDAPSAASVIDRAREEGVDPAVVASLPSVDIDEAMRAWRDLAQLLETTPLYPVASWAEMLDFLSPLLLQQPGWEQIEHAVDEALERVRGGDVAAQRARQRALQLHEAGQLRAALAELHRAIERWWSGDNLRPALACMLGAGDVYKQLHLPQAAKHYYLAVAGGAHSSSDDNLTDLVPHAFMLASKLDYATGAWASAIEHADLGLLAQSVLTDPDVDPWVQDDLNDAVITLGMSLRCARSLVPEMLPAVERVASKYGMLTDLEKSLEGTPEWPPEEWIRLTDEQLDGRPFSDIGDCREFRFAALGTSWRIHSSSEYRAARAAERLAAAAQILLVELADDDLCLARIGLDIEVRVAEDVPADERVQRDQAKLWHWIVNLNPLTPGEPMDEEAHFTETLATLVKIVSDVSLLPARECLDLTMKAFERGLGSKLAVGRPFEELAEVVTDERYAETPRGLTPPLRGDEPEPREHPELAWQDGPGPTYSRTQAEEALARRYDLIPTRFGPTIKRLREDSAFALVVTELRGRGWLDWHLLTAVSNIVGNNRLASAGLNSRTALQEPGAAARATELMTKQEEEDDAPVPVARFTSEAMDAFRRGAIADYAMGWGLQPKVAIDAETLEQVLADRYAYWTDDIEHDDPFPAA